MDILNGKEILVRGKGNIKKFPQYIIGFNLKLEIELVISGSLKVVEVG